ncbi:MAG: hypothetical protein QW701_01970 [Candidatus Nezhaarchaeales archaeon]
MNLLERRNVKELLEEKGTSLVVSLVITSATLLIVVVSSSFFATNLLEVQVQNSEFEQAKTAMLLLDRVITDVSLRLGAASSIPFNQRSSGVGVYKGETMNITILSGSSVLLNKSISSYVIKYRGGRMASVAETNLRDPGGLIIKDRFKSLGRIQVKVEEGAWITLDYNRVRIAVNENLKVMDIYLIRLEPGSFGSSGSIMIRVQNKDVKVEPILLGCTIDNLRVLVTVGDLMEYQDYSKVSTIRIVEVVIVVSIT